MTTPESTQAAPAPLWSKDKQARYIDLIVNAPHPTEPRRAEFAQLTMLQVILTSADALVCAIHASAAVRMMPDERQAMLDELVNVMVAVSCTQSVVWDAHHHVEGKA